MEKRSGLPEEGTPPAYGARQYYRAKSQDAGNFRFDPDRGSENQPGADYRRERHRKRTCGACDSREQPTLASAVHHHQLRSISRDITGVGTFRIYERRFYRRERKPTRFVSGGTRRHAIYG